MQIQLPYIEFMNKNNAVIIEIKRGLSALRELRDALIKLAVSLARDSGKRGYLLLVDPKLNKDRLALEINGIKSTLLPDVAKRLLPVFSKKGEILPGEARLEDAGLLQRTVDESGVSGVSLPSSDTQSEVFLVLLQQWIAGKTPVTSKRLAEIVGCAYRTVSAALQRLGPSIKRFSNRSVTFKYFPDQEWKRSLAVMNKIRSTIRYADASDQPRSPESLLKRLRQLRRDDIAVGGVFGAKHHYPDLDIIGAPRLDLCLNVPGARVDLDFVRLLDPALERIRDPHRPARLALHFMRRMDPLFDRGNEGFLWADEVECLLELFDAGLEHQALEFQSFLTAQANKQRAEN